MTTHPTSAAYEDEASNDEGSTQTAERPIRNEPNSDPSAILPLTAPAHPRSATRPPKSRKVGRLPRGQRG